MNFLNLIRSKVFTNSLWMMSEKIIAIFGLIFVTSYVAKYIGPENFGKLNFVMSLFGIVQIFAWFGCDNILFQRISKNSISGWNLIKLTRKIRDLSFFVSAIPLLAYLYIYTDKITFYFGMATAISTYIVTHDLYSIYYNAKLQASTNTVANVVGLIVSLTVRYFIVFYELNYILIVVPIVLVSLIPFLIRWYLFNYIEGITLLKNKKVTKKYNNFLFINGANLLLYTLSVAIFTRTAQFFLGIVVSMKNLGIYTVAATLGGSFSFVIIAFISSIMVKVYSEKNVKKAENMLSNINILIFTVSVIVILILSFVGSYIISWLYGAAYYEASHYLALFSIATMFAGLSTVAEKYIMKFQGYSYLLKKMLILVVINIPLTYFLVKKYEIYGAAYSVILTEILSLTVLNYFYRNGLIFKVHVLTIKNLIFLKFRDD